MVTVVHGWLADGVWLLHAAFLLFLVVGGFLAWRWRRLLWVHLIVLGWSVTIVLVRFPCPFTEWEKSLRRRAGEPSYEGSYIRHYLEGRLWPESYTDPVTYAAFGVAALSYIGFAIRARRHS